MSVLTSNGASEPSKSFRVKIPYQFDAKAVLWLLGVIGTIGITCFWLYSDKHNAELFIPRAEYAKDQEQRKSDQLEISKTLRRFERNQEETQKDIKDILKELKK